MKKTLLVIVICCALVASWVFLIGNKKEVTSVALTEVERRDIKEVVELSGSVVSANIYTLSSPTGGLVEEVYVEQGDKVSSGKILVKLKSDQLELELQKAELELDQLESFSGTTPLPVSGEAETSAQQSILEERAKIALALSQTVGFDFESFNSAFSDDLAEQYSEYEAILTSGLSQGSLEDYERNFNQETNISQAQIDIAKIAVSSLEESIDDMSLRTDIGGEVISINCFDGSFLAPGMPAIVVADPDDIRIEAVALEKDIMYLENNMSVNIIPNDDSEYYFEGNISKVGNLETTVSQFQTPDVMARVTITPSSNFTSKLGASMDIEVVLDGRENVLAIPVDCISEDGNVFTLTDDVVSEKEIITGFTDGYYIEVISGLFEGEEIILCPEGIEEGDKVEVE